MSSVLSGREDIIDDDLLTSLGEGLVQYWRVESKPWVKLLTLSSCTVHCTDDAV